MTTIYINEFSKYDQPAIYEFLVLQKETSFEIKIPKKTLATKDDFYSMFSEYSHAAYAGQKLFEIASKFEFHFININQEFPFVFKMKTEQMEKLAELLYTFVQFFYDRDNIDLVEEFENKAIDFYITAFEQKIETLGTYGLLCMARECLEKSW